MSRDKPSPSPSLRQYKQDGRGAHGQSYIHMHTFVLLNDYTRLTGMSCVFLRGTRALWTHLGERLQRRRVLVRVCDMLCCGACFVCEGIDDLITMIRSRVQVTLCRFHPHSYVFGLYNLNLCHECQWGGVLERADSLDTARAGRCRQLMLLLLLLPASTSHQSARVQRMYPYLHPSKIPAKLKSAGQLVIRSDPEPHALLLKPPHRGPSSYSLLVGER